MRKEVQQKRGCGATEASLLVSTVRALYILQPLLWRRSECARFYSPNVSFVPLEAETQAGRKPRCPPMNLLNGVTKDQVSQAENLAPAHCWLALVWPPVISFLLVMSLYREHSSLKLLFISLIKDAHVSQVWSSAAW